ncbi:hypothetical protein LCGC14_1361280, partial [marine sediment metagenome]
IAFQSSMTWKIWDVFTSKDYRHCFLFMDQDDVYGAGTILCEYRRGWMVMEDYILDAAAIIEVLKTCPEQSTVLRITLDPWEQKRYPACGLMTCVSIIKAVLRVRGFWILTPKQLLNHLRILGAETVLETHHGKKSETGRSADPTAKAASRFVAR